MRIDPKQKKKVYYHQQKGIISVHYQQMAIDNSKRLELMNPSQIDFPSPTTYN